VLPVVEIARVEAVAPFVNVDGVSVAVAPLGRPVTLTAMSLVKFVRAAVTAKLVDEPRVTVWVAGEAEIEKLGLIAAA
jgi:hypothetical protein